MRLNVRLGGGLCLVGGSGFRRVVVLNRRIVVIRRGFQRRSFGFGVQWSVLDLFRIQDVCHNCQLRDSWVGGPEFRLAQSGDRSPHARPESELCTLFGVTLWIQSRPAKIRGSKSSASGSAPKSSRRRHGVWPVEWPGTTVSMVGVSGRLGIRGAAITALRMNPARKNYSSTIGLPHSPCQRAPRRITPSRAAHTGWYTFLSHAW